MPLSEPIIATEADIPEIARLYVAATPNSAARTMIFQNTEDDEIRAYMEGEFKLDIARPDGTYLIIKDVESGEIASFAKWEGPYPAELRAAAIQEVRSKAAPIPQSANAQAVKEFAEKIADLRKRVLGDPHRDAWVCGNVATHPGHQKKGAASRLMRWPFEQADRDQVPVYLETNSAGPAVSMYKKLGFVETGDNIEIEKSKYGGEGLHYHIAMIRSPDSS